MGHGNMKRGHHQRNQQRTLSFQEQQTIRNAADFVDSATPLGLSVGLTHLGVATSHRDGIEKIIEHFWAEAKAVDNIARDRGIRVTAGLIGHWEKEIAAKNRPELALEEFAVLAEVARFYVEDWAVRRECEASSDHPASP